MNSDSQPSVAIGNRTVGPGSPVYIIAEAGVNHDGDPAAARKLIQAAHDAGADAVKFQVFSADRLVSRSAAPCAYQKKQAGAPDSQHEMLKKLELCPAVFAELIGIARSVGVQFLATPFGVPELKLLVDLKVPAIKTASTDLVNVPLLEAAAESGLPLIVSTGASTLAEVDQAVALISGLGAGERLVLLHCVSAYPTRPEATRLRRIQVLAERFGVPVGFSDHTPDPRFSAVAVAAGAIVLEKHLTLDRRSPGPDHSFSLTPPDFAEYVAAARMAAAALGPASPGEEDLAAEEIEVRKLARGSIVALRTITKGQRITPECLTVRRPGNGISPSEWHSVVGRLAKTDISADATLEWRMLEGEDRPEQR
jgi:N,N'-diacetyllegionaminate synthase